MSDNVYKWAARELDTIEGSGPDGHLTMAEGVAMVQVLTYRIAQTVEDVRPPVTEYGTRYPVLPKMNWEQE